MLKRIGPEDVSLGMYVYKLEGSWFKHPFWKSKFLLTDVETLADLRASDVDGVVIDVSKGCDVARRPALSPARLASPAAVSAAPARRSAPHHFGSRASTLAHPPAFDMRGTSPQSMAREFGTAGIIAAKSQKVISRLFLQSRLGKKISASQIEPVIEDIFASIQRNPHAFNGLMRCKRDNEFIYKHALAVSALMISLARQLKLRPETIREAGMAGLLMDVGIGHLPIDFARIGNDVRLLDDDLIQGHTRLGHDFLAMGGGIPESVAQVCLQHHERMDASGYPDGISGDAIAPLARMAAICDIYDALVTDGADRRGLDPAAALEKMTMMNAKLDRTILGQFIQMMGIYPIGSVVRLRSGRLALVVDQDPEHVSHPRVRAFYAIATRKLVAPQDIALSRCFGSDEIVSPDDPEAYGLQNFARLRANIFAAASAANR